jgi:hypothetical protein
LPSDRPHTFEATVALTEVAKKAESTCAIRAVTPCPGTLDFEEWAEDEPSRTDVIDGAPVRGRLAFVLVSNFYRQMYANTGIATDSARVARVCPVRSLDRKGVPAFLRGPSDGGAGTAELNAAHP